MFTQWIGVAVLGTVLAAVGGCATGRYTSTGQADAGSEARHADDKGHYKPEVLGEPPRSSVASNP